MCSVHSHLYCFTLSGGITHYCMFHCHDTMSHLYSMFQPLRILQNLLIRPLDEFCLKPIIYTEVSLQLAVILACFRKMHWVTGVVLPTFTIYVSGGSTPVRSETARLSKAKITEAALHHGPLLVLLFSVCVSLSHLTSPYENSVPRGFWVMLAHARWTRRRARPHCTLQNEGRMNWHIWKVGPVMQSTWPLLWTHRLPTCSQPSHKCYALVNRWERKKRLDDLDTLSPARMHTHPVCKFLIKNVHVMPLESKRTNAAKNSHTISPGNAFHWSGCYWVYELQRHISVYWHVSLSLINVCTHMLTNIFYWPSPPISTLWLSALPPCQASLIFLKQPCLFLWRCQLVM